MRIRSLSPTVLPQGPAAVFRLEYASELDDQSDWALVRPGRHRELWVVVCHGHGSQGDQLYTRPDIRAAWLPAIERLGAGILTPNLRGNAWMSPAAVADLHDLLGWLREQWGGRQFVLFSGSMGGTGNLIYAVRRPDDVAAVVALGAATDLAAYYHWCRQQSLPVCAEIADAIAAHYGGTPEEQPDVYAAHNVLGQTAALRMPVYLAHGERDALMPVNQARALAKPLAGGAAFRYEEIPDGDHDSPLHRVDALEWVRDRLGP
ncbi:alpha/beta fold hydrolase [bacterium]|nr:alpha/beta fold hydrolase [bacterium]